VGVAALYQEPDRLDAAELLQVWVEPAHRGTELAACVLEYLWSWATENGYDKVVAEVNNVNVRAISFNKKQGFAVSEELQSLRKLSGRETMVLVKSL
jgi:ribosomal protein S18 acetylase RimI-like enzyme